MDESPDLKNTEADFFKKQYCAHGKPLRGSFWAYRFSGFELDGKWEPHLSFFLSRTRYLIRRCCGKGMLRIKMPCVKMGPQGFGIGTYKKGALCECCGNMTYYN